MNIALLMMLSGIPNGGCHVVQAAVVKQEVVAQQIVQPILIPLYSFAYYPQPYVAPVYQQPVYQQQVVQQPVQQQVAPQPLQQQEAACDLCLELRQLRLEVAKLRGVPAPVATEPPPITTQPLTALNIVSQKCAVCHSSASAPMKGGGFVLLAADGKIAPLSLAEKRRVVDVIIRDKMPKAHPGQQQVPLTQAEKDVLKNFLEGGVP